MSTANKNPCRAMLMAAGRGERMRPLTDDTAKPLLEVNGKSLIVYHLEKLALAGVTQVVINTSWHADKIVSALGDGSDYGLQIEYSHEPQALETAGGVRKALPLLGARPFILISTDVWCDIDYCELVNATAMVDEVITAAHLLMVDNPAHHRDGDFSIDGTHRLRQKDSQTSDGKTDISYTYSGIGVYSPALFEGLPVAPCPLREILYTAIAAGQVSAESYSGKWFDVGTTDRLQELNDFLKL